MRNEYDKEINNDAEKNIVEFKNAFNDIKKFLQLLLVSQLMMLYFSGREMIFGNIDSLPAVAAINTVLVFLTIHHIRKMKIGNQK